MPQKPALVGAASSTHSSVPKGTIKALQAPPQSTGEDLFADRSRRTRMRLYWESRADKAGSRGFPFLSLPAEIRNQVYICYIRDAFAAALHGTAHHESCKNTLEPIHSGCGGPLSKQSLSLLGTNRHIRQEAREVLFTNVKARFDVYRYLPDGPQNQLGIFLGESTLNTLYHDCRIPNWYDISKVSMEFVAGFRNLDLYVYLGPEFPTARSYCALKRQMVDLRKAMDKEDRKSTAERKVTVFWQLCEPPADTSAPLTKRVLKYLEVKHTLRTIEWLFSGIPHTKFHASLNTHDDMEDAPEMAEDLEIDPNNPSASWFRRNDWAERRWQVMSLEANEAFGDYISDMDESDSEGASADEDTLGDDALDEA